MANDKMSYQRQSGLPAMRSGAARTMQELAPQPISVGQPLTNIGNVAGVQGYMGVLPPLDTFSVTLNNTSSANLTYIIGDPTQGIANQVGGTISNPSACSWDSNTPGTGVVPMKLSFGYAPVAIQGFNYQTSSDASQFFQRLRGAASDIKGNLNVNPLPIAAQQRNNQFNDLLLTVDLVNPFVLNWQNALVITVLAGEEVNLVFTPYMAAGRI